MKELRSQVFEDNLYRSDGDPGEAQDPQDQPAETKHGGAKGLGGAGAPLPDCVGAPAGALRINGSYNPGRLRCVSEVGRPLRAPAGLALSKAATTHPIRPTSARELLHMCEP